MAFTQRGREHEKDMARIEKEAEQQKALDEKAKTDAQRAFNERIVLEKTKRA